MILRIKKKVPKPAAIQARNRQRRIKIDSGAVETFCAALAESLGISGRAFSVIFIGTDAMRRLNNEWRKKDCATDVLSFSYGGEIVDGMPFIGEIVISPEIAARRADARARGARGGCPVPASARDAHAACDRLTDRELRMLIVHGTLHLMGYDHEIDGGEMLRIQNNVSRRRFFKECPILIRREGYG